MLSPTTALDRTRNELRPHTLDDVVGQDNAKTLMRKAIASCFRLARPLDHVMLVGPSGTGKSTFSHAIANDLGVDVYELEAPVSTDTLLELRTQMFDGDILKIEEIHQQAIMERRGRSAATQPEVLYAVLEDRVLPTASGVLEFPRITMIGTTTDEGMLPDAFLNRFPLQPRLEAYTEAQLATIVRNNARAMGLVVYNDAAMILARASRGVPRAINNFVKNAAILGLELDRDCALEVLAVNNVTSDGLNADMQAMLTFLRTRAKRTRGNGEVVYQASVSSVATAIGKSRDVKAIQLRVEPYLIQQGYVQVVHGGRILTDAGIEKAEELL